MFNFILPVLFIAASAYGGSITLPSNNTEISKWDLLQAMSNLLVDRHYQLHHQYRGSSEDTNMSYNISCSGRTPSNNSVCVNHHVKQLYIEPTTSKEILNVDLSALHDVTKSVSSDHALHTPDKEHPHTDQHLHGIPNLDTHTNRGLQNNVTLNSSTQLKITPKSQLHRHHHGISELTTHQDRDLHPYLTLNLHTQQKLHSSSHLHRHKRIADLNTHQNKGLHHHLTLNQIPHTQQKQHLSSYPHKQQHETLERNTYPHRGRHHHLTLNQKPHTQRKQHLSSYPHKQQHETLERNTHHHRDLHHHLNLNPHLYHSDHLIPSSSHSHRHHHGIPELNKHRYLPHHLNRNPHAQRKLHRSSHPHRHHHGLNNINIQNRKNKYILQKLALNPEKHNLFHKLNYKNQPPEAVIHQLPELQTLKSKVLKATGDKSPNKTYLKVLNKNH